jgi:hypothetical protein
LSAEPRSTLPSIATTSPLVATCTACTQDRKACGNGVGSRAAKTRAKVSWEGAPFGGSRKRRNQGSVAWANAATDTQLSAPQMIPHSAITRMADNR